MSKKISKYFIEHSIECIVFAFILLVVFALIIILSPKFVAEIISGCLVGFMFFILILALQRERQEKLEMQAMGIKEYKQKWKQYVDLLDEVIKEKNFNRDKLYKDWIKVFNQTIYAIATDQYILNREFNDFDIAACMIYSLTCENDTDENILFVFDCVKKIINEPKEYIRNLGYGYKLELEVDKTFPKANISIPDKVITPGALAEIIRAYLNQKEDADVILQLSDFLHVMYLKCSET